MRKERKQELMHSFPAVPHFVEEQMKGRGALNFCVFLTNGHELFVRCFHRYKGGEIAERQRYVFAKDGAVRYILDGYSTTKWKVATEFKEYQKYLEELKREQERNKQKLQQSTGAA